MEEFEHMHLAQVPMITGEVFFPDEFRAARDPAIMRQRSELTSGSPDPASKKSKPTSVAQQVVDARTLAHTGLQI